MRLTYAAGLPLAWLLWVQSVRGYSICKDCRTPEQMVAPGIGFDLTHSYGTAAIRFQNGSNIFVGRVNADEAYNAMMEYRSSEDSRPELPHDPWSELKYRYALWERRANKALGRPATPEVGHIANLLSQLRTITEEHLGGPITAVVISRPALPGFHPRDLEDAAEYLNLTILHSYRQETDIHENQAVFASSSRGLCEHPEDIAACQSEESLLPWHMVGSFSFTNTCLSLSEGHFMDVYNTFDYAAFFYPDLGRGRISDYASPDVYWREMKDTLKDFFITTDLSFDIMQVFGEAAADETFLETLKDAIRESGHFVTQSDGGESAAKDPEKLAVWGAAELAKRFQVMTWGCVESSRCDRREDQKISYDQEIFDSL